jgi:hypothetical protein
MIRDRILALRAAGGLTDAQFARAVALGLAPPADAPPAVRAQATNRAALLAKAATALTTNATYLAIASPTNAQNTAQVKALTRQVNALLKLATAALSDTTGT